MSRPIHGHGKCGDCQHYANKFNGCDLTKGVVNPNRGEKCPLRPVMFYPKEETAEYRMFGYPEVWHLIHEKPPKDQVTFESAKGTVSFKKGAKKNAKKSTKKGKTSVRKNRVLK